MHQIYIASSSCNSYDGWGKTICTGGKMNRRTLEKIREEEMMLEEPAEEQDEEYINELVEDGELGADYGGFWLGYRRAS